MRRSSEEKSTTINTEQIEKRNFLPLTIEGAIFTLGIVFLNQDGVISVFIDSYSGRMELVGLAVTIKLFLGMAPRILVGPHVSRIKNIPEFTFQVMLVTRAAPILIALALILGPPTNFLMTVFFIAYGILWLGHGIIVVTWIDIFGRTISGRNRGRMHGYQQVLGGIGGIGAALIIKQLLDHPTLAVNYKFGAIFAIAGLVCALSALPMLIVRDLERPESNRSMNYRNYFKSLTALFYHKKEYRRMVGSMVPARIALLANPFIILAARNIIGLDERMISTLIFLQIVGGLVGGLIWGSISHRMGNQEVILPPA